MKNGKIIISIMIMSIIIAGGSFAAIKNDSVQRYFSNIKLMLNGTVIVPKDANGNTVEPFIIDGTTYLPVRAIANALGMSVEWDANSGTVKLSDPNILKSGVKVYEDNFVKIEFVKCEKATGYAYYDYNAIYNITNKTDYVLTFQPEAVSFNGISYKVSGSEEVAPNSTGVIKFGSDDELPLIGITKTTGAISVVDFSYEVFRAMSYKINW